MSILKMFSTVAAFALLFSIACTKGNTGPAGPAGAAGPDSVLHSAWTQVILSMGVDANNDTFYSQNIAAASITQNVLDSSLIMGYISYLDSAGQESIFNASESFNITYSVGNVLLVDYFGDLSYYNTGYSFRYVIVPGSILTNAAFKQYTKAQIKTMTYSQLEQLVSNSKPSGSPN
jgi:hypothetical protein